MEKLKQCILSVPLKFNRTVSFSCLLGVALGLFFYFFSPPLWIESFSFRVILKIIILFSVFIFTILFPKYIETNLGEIKNQNTKILFYIMLSFLSACVLNQILLTWSNNQIPFFTKWQLYRTLILTFLTSFLILNLLIPTKELYSYLFKYRWQIGFFLLLFCIIFKLNGSSVGMYNFYIQPNSGTDLGKPLFGEARSIRSDEWAVYTPMTLSSQFGNTPYSRFNYILGASQTEAFGMTRIVNYGFSILASPLLIGYILLGPERGLSLAWYGVPIVAFLCIIELLMILTSKNKLWSVTGAFLIVFSTYYFWWSFNPTYIWTGPAALVCAYYFIVKTNWKWKILFGFGFASSMANFITWLYPAWQVPAGYLFLLLGLWIIFQNKEKIFQFTISDWFITVTALLLLVSIVISTFLATSDYIKIISKTVYPGSRNATGGYILSSLARYFQAPFYADATSSGNLINPSEGGSFYTLFPLPIFLAISICVKKIYKKEKLDSLFLIILAYSIVIGSYCTFTWPNILAKITFMYQSPPERAGNVFALSQIILLIVIFTRVTDVKYKKIESICMALFTSFWAGINTLNIPLDNHMNAKLTPFEIFLSFSTIFFLCYILTQREKKRFEKIACTILIGISIFSTYNIHPIMQGLGAIYEKPVAIEIQTLIEKKPNEKWISVEAPFLTSNYMTACGAPTINSTNFYPNLERWENLGLSEYENVYNRYAHISVILTNEQSKFTLMGADSIQLDLNYNDLKKLEISYILSPNPNLESFTETSTSINKIYEEDGISIYEVKYI